MKAFFASFLAVMGAVIVLAMMFAPPVAWQRALPRVAQRFAEPRQRTAQEQAARTREQTPHQVQATEELAEQRRERLALLTATLGGNPLARLTDAERRLFQDAERRRARAAGEAEQRPVVRLLEPVQIDEWTTLLPGTPVEFVGYHRDDAVTIRYQGARYEIAAAQAGLPAIEPLPDRWWAPSVEDARSVDHQTHAGSFD